MDALYEWNGLDAQNERARYEQNAAHESGEIASDVINRVAPSHLLDAIEMSHIHRVIAEEVYNVLMARYDALPTLDSIPW